MRNIIFYILLSSFFLIGCSNNEATKAKSEEPVKEIVKFKSVEEGEQYLWEKAEEGAPYSEIEEILADEHYMSESDYGIVKTVYSEASERVEGMNELDGNNDTEINDIIVTEKEGALIKRWPKYRMGVSDFGYEAEFVNEDGTFKLVKVIDLYN